MMAWAAMTGDPGIKILHWLKQGAPAGICLQIPDIGVFPTKDSMPTASLDEVYAEQLALGGNYSSLEDDVDAEAIMSEILDPAKRWVKTFTSEADVKHYLGADPVVSPLGLVTKHKKDDKGVVVSTKKRVSLDAKRSRANELARSSHRLLLPRPHHAIDDTLCMQRSLRARLRRAADHARRKDGLAVEQLVADYEDAYWAVPLAFPERRFQVFRWRELWAVLLRTGQGARESSLTWA